MQSSNGQEEHVIINITASVTGKSAEGEAAQVNQAGSAEKLL